MKNPTQGFWVGFFVLKFVININSLIVLDCNLFFQQSDSFF